MKTETKAITPSEAGLSLNVVSGPRGHFADDWQAIEYTCELLNARRTIIWSGSYKLGIGHVKWPTLAQINSFYGSIKHGFTPDEENVCRIHARGQTVKKTPEGMKVEASTAAKLAKVQKVVPQLNDVCHSLLSDGSALFDGQRFEDWASDLGYDPDSRKAEATFRACDEIGRSLSRHLSRDELDGLREWASNY